MQRGELNVVEHLETSGLFVHLIQPSKDFCRKPSGVLRGQGRVRVRHSKIDQIRHHGPTSLDYSHPVPHWPSLREKITAGITNRAGTIRFDQGKHQSIPFLSTEDYEARKLANGWCAEHQPGDTYKAPGIVSFVQSYSNVASHSAIHQHVAPQWKVLHEARPHL